MEETAESLRLRYLLLTLAELMERALASPFQPPPKAGGFDAEQSPAISVASIVPAAGGTMVERPALSTSLTSLLPKDLPPPDEVLEGFEVKVVGGKVLVGKGKYRKGGEVREFAGAEVDLPPPNHFIVFSLLTERVETTMNISPLHFVLYK